LPTQVQLPPSEIAEEPLAVRSIAGILLPQVGMRRLGSLKLASAVLPLLAGVVLALLTLALGPVTLPIVFFVLFVLPWLMQDAFRLFIWLIVTWPILTLYVRIPLPAGIPDISYERVLVLLLLCVVILEALQLKRRLMKATLLDILVIVYVVAQLSSRLFVLWFGAMGTPDLNGLLDVILVPLVMYWMAKNLLVSRVHLKWFLCALVIACLLVCLSGLYDRSVGADGEWSDVPGGRAAGVLENPGIYGATLGMGILAAICCLPHLKRKLTQAALVTTIGVLLYGVLVSYTRSAWISVLTVLFGAQFLVNGLWRRTLPIFILVLVLLVFMWDQLPANSPYMRRALTTHTATPRLALAQIGWQRFLERPFLGWGSGALNTFGRGQVGTISHNVFLTFLVDGGLALFLGFSVAVGYVLIRAIRVHGMTEKSSLERHVMVAMTGGILIYLLSAMFLELRYFGYFNALFWICAGVIDRLGVNMGARSTEHSDGD
jgi:hypothetical protein